MKTLSCFSRHTARAFGAAMILALAPAACASDRPSPASTATPEPGAFLFGNYLAGRHALTVGDVDTAATMLLRTVEQDPENTALRNTAFVAALRAGRIAPALKLAESIAKDKKPLEIALLALAVEDIRAGNREAALKHLAPLETSKTYSFLTPILHAWAEAGAGRTEQALDAMKMLGAREGFATIVTLHSALIKDMAGDTKGAEEAFAALRKGDQPMSLRLVQLMGAFHQRHGEMDEARDIYKSYDTNRPGSAALDTVLAALDAGAAAPRYVKNAAEGAAEALVGLASALSQQNGRETAEVFVRLALHLKPGFPTAQLLLAGLMEADDRRAEAADVYAAIPASSPLKMTAMIRSADNLDHLKKTDDAIRVLREIAAARPNDPQPVMDLGDILRRHERFSDAVEAYDEAEKRLGTLEARHWALLYTRGIALERSQNWTRAEKDFQRALDFEPNQALVLNYLGYTWVEKGVHLAEAEAMIRKAVSLRPSDGYVVDSLGWVLHRLGRPLEAVKEMERAVELRPEDPVINDHLGDVYWTVGRTREARFQWTRALGLNPEPDVATALKDKLKSGLPAKAVK